MKMKPKFTWIILLALIGSHSMAMTCDSSSSLPGRASVIGYCANANPGSYIESEVYWHADWNLAELRTSCVQYVLSIRYVLDVGGDYLYSSCGGNFITNGGGGAGTPNGPTCGGSVIQPIDRVLGETIRLQKSSFDLVYSSDRTKGYRQPFESVSNITGSTVRSDTVDVDIEIRDESNTVVDSQTYSNTADQTHPFVWDGLTSSSVEAWASVPYTILIRENFTSDSVAVPKRFNYGKLNVKKLGLGGWAPSVWMFYDANAEIIHRGDGSIRNVRAQNLSGGGYRVAKEDGSEVYDFNSTGLIVSIKHGITGTALYTFTYSSGKLTQIDEPHSKTTTFTYSSGLLSSITNPYSETFSIDLDTNGYIEEVTTPGSLTYEMAYDSNGLLLTFEKPTGAISEFTYDSKGFLEKDEHSGGYFADIAASGANRTYTSRMGRVTSFTSSSGSNYITRPWGATDTYSSLADGSSVSSQGTVTSQTGDLDIRFGSTSYLPTTYSRTGGSSYFTLSRTDTVNLNSSDPFDIDTWVTRLTSGTIDTEIEFDGSNKEWNTTSDVGRTSRYKIDTYGRPVEIQVGTLTTTAFTYSGEYLSDIDQGARNTSFTHSGGLLTSVTNDKSEVTSYSYDANGKLDIMTLPDSREIDFDYDGTGNLVSVTPAGRSAHIFNFNTSELLGEYAPPLLYGIPNVTTDYSYNYDNQLVQIDRPDGQSIEYDYNLTTGLLSSVTTPTRTITISYVYNKNLPYAYDHSSGIDVNRYYSGEYMNQEEVIDNSSNFIGYFSSALSSSYPDIAYDEAGGGSGGSRSITYTYDNDRVLTGTGDIGLTYATPNGTLTSTDFGDIDDLYGYNAFGEVTAYDATYISTNKYSLDLTRDDLGRVTQKIEVINGGSTNTYDYTYDSSGRLIDVDKNSTGYSTYSYDDNNNRTGGSINSVSTAATYDDQDRMTDFNVFDYTYNANGDLLTKTNTMTTEVWSYVYDAEGNLLSVTLPNTHVISYEVDGLNRRIEKRDNSTLLHRYIYDPKGRIVGEINTGSLTLKRRYVYVSKSNIPDYFYEGSDKYRIISDYLGSPRVVIKEDDGTVMQTMNHDEFGRVVSDSNPGYLPFGFAGGIYDPDTGLVRFGARDYDPEAGRWLSKDPILFSGDGPNLYGYVMNDPVNLIDRTGEQSECIGEFCDQPALPKPPKPQPPPKPKPKPPWSPTPGHPFFLPDGRPNPYYNTPGWSAGGRTGSNGSGGDGSSCKL